MDADEYQRRALETAGKGTKRSRQIYTALGAAGEAGEICDLTKKWLYHDHPYQPERFLEEAGDAIWYLAINAHAHGFTLSEVMEFNVAKLKKRYPEGFTPQRSINRTK